MNEDRYGQQFWVALRKESVDRKVNLRVVDDSKSVALRKESVDRKVAPDVSSKIWYWSLSARRAWIEKRCQYRPEHTQTSRSPQGERG